MLHTWLNGLLRCVSWEATDLNSIYEKRCTKLVSLYTPFWAKYFTEGINVNFNFCSCFSVFIKIQSSVSCYMMVNQMYFMFQVLHWKLLLVHSSKSKSATGMNLSSHEVLSPYLSKSKTPLTARSSMIVIPSSIASFYSFIINLLGLDLR